VTTPGLTAQPLNRGRIQWEIAIVLALGLGRSAVYSIVALLDLLTRGAPLGDQTTTLNPPLSDRPWLDLTYQLLGIVFSLGPVVLVCFLLWSDSRPHLGRLGFDGKRLGRDSLWGVLLVAVIGIPGLAIYLGGRAAGLGVGVEASALDPNWWTIPVLALSALRAGLQEEVVVLGYLFARLGDLGWNKWSIIIGSAVLRGSYHLYQGWAAFVGNLLMGLLFGWLFARTRRIWPFIVAHALLDSIIFIGYPWAAATWPGLFGLPH
jgi:membrane protease YdiL (CAAX protease family)